ncbi:MAG: radical SAM protein [Nitrospirota bacterium]
MSRRLREKALALLGREQGTVFKEPGGKLRVCLLYPNTYRVGMSNLGMQGVYGLLNGRDDVFCERAFLPDAEDMEEYVRTGTELFSLETQTPVGRFDVVAFSTAFENDYPNIIRVLRLSRIPPRAEERTGRHPLVVMGGICAFANPEPLAEFFDLVFVGEAEELLPDFLEACTRAEGREDLLRRAASGIRGVYVPRFYAVDYGPGGLIARRRILWEGAPETIERRFVRDFSRCALRPVVITPDAEFASMYLLEAQRGCPWNCNFCLAGHVFNPPRVKALDAVRAEVEEALARARKVGLIGPSLADYPHKEDVLSIPGVDFSITSLRASPRSAALAALLQGQRSISIAPEAGTQRMREVINKKITEEDILETAGSIFSWGVSRLRLYFMVGLPTERDEDARGIVRLVTAIRGLSARGKIVLTLSTFVPKPSTPFQWHPMEEMRVVKERMKLVKEGLASLPGVSVFHDVPKYAYMQGMLSVGDRRTARALLAIARDEAHWRGASRRAGVDPDFYAMRRKGRDEILPWDFIQAGVSKERLWRAYRSALAHG